MPRATFQWPRPHASTGSPATLAGSFGSVSCGVTAPLLWVLMSVNFCLCPPRLEFLLPLILWKSHNQILLALKDRFPEDSKSLCQISRLGSLKWGSETSQQCENFFGIIVLQSVGHPPGGYGIWFDCVYTPTTILLWLLCFWKRGIFFGGFQHSPVNGCSTSSCNFGALAGGDECMSFYSAILNQKLMLSWYSSLCFFQPSISQDVLCI